MCKALNMMKPWQTFIKQKHAAKGERKNKGKDSSPTQKLKKPKGVTKGAKQQIMFQSPHQSQEAYPQKKWKKTLRVLVRNLFQHTHP